MVNGLLDGLVDGTHGDDDLLGIRCAVIVEQLVIRADLGIDFVHVLLNDGRHRVVGGVAGLTGLEEQVGVLRGAHLTGMCRIEAVRTELCDRVVIDQIVQIVIVPDLDLLDLVGCTESVEEVDEGKFALPFTAAQ